MTCQRYASASSRNLRRLNKNAAKGGDVSMHAMCLGAEGHTPGVGGVREGAGCKCAKVAVVSASAPPRKKRAVALKHGNVTARGGVGCMGTESVCKRESA